MKTLTILGVLAVPALLCAFATGCDATPGSAQSGGAPRSGPASPVLVELFTSQGCSSCPPADQLLSALDDDPQLAGRVIPLAYHVDYWNSIGWDDPFSSGRWSGRQSKYAKALGNGTRIYTPQLVVNGQSDCVGSNRRDVQARIAEALNAPAAGRVTLTATPGTDAVKVRVEAAVAGKDLGRDLDVMVALYENGLSTAVPRGENASRTLHNDYVVRRLEKAFTLPPAPGSRQAGEVTLPLDRTWKRANLGVAAFLQDPVTFAVHGAAARPLAGGGR